MQLCVPIRTAGKTAGFLILAAFVWGFLCLACCGRAYLNPTHHSVYGYYSHAGRAWTAGKDAYETDTTWDGIKPKSSPYRYPPPVSVLLVPFSFLPDSVGGVLWRLVSFLCFFWAFAWYLREALPGGNAYEDKEKALLWLLLIPLSLGSMYNGQANVLLIGFVLGAGAAVVKERWNLAAALMAGAVLMKIYPLAIALLLILIHPRRLGWRFLAALAIGLLIPFALQKPAYVLRQYEIWFLQVAGDDRRDLPMSQGYRDFYLLTRFFGAPLAPWAYQILQLIAAAAVAGMGLLGRQRDWLPGHLVTTLLTLGCGWIAVFGPATESSTLILIAPGLAWSLVDSFQPGRPAWSRGALLLVLGLLLVTNIATWFPGGRDWFYLLQPVAALLFLVERYCASLTAKPKSAKSAWVIQTSEVSKTSEVLLHGEEK